MGNRYHK